jgi:coenzyme PQQ synthesis protein D (PqqD)
MQAKTTQLKLTPHARSIIDEDGAVILNTENGKYYSVNRIGAHMLKRLAAGTTHTELVAEVAAAFAGNPEADERVKNDVQEFLEQLNTNGILEVRNGG